MSEPIVIKNVAASVLAGLRVNADVTAFGPQIMGSLDKVYAFLKTARVRQSGHNVIFYEGMFVQGAPVQIAVQVSAEFAAAGEIECLKTPAGTVASVMHRGPYDQLSRTHQALHVWCKSQSQHVLAGPSWEIYGDWSDDPAKLETEVLYLLAR